MTEADKKQIAELKRTIAELEQQKQDLKYRISAIENKRIECGRAMFRKNHFEGSGRDEYHIEVKRIVDAERKLPAERWYSIIITENTSSINTCIDHVVADLQALKVMLKDKV